MSDALTKEYLDEQIDVVISTVKVGFDHVDERMSSFETRMSSFETRMSSFETRLTGVEEDLSYVKDRLRVVENDVRALGAGMVTKQYLDEKFDQLLIREHKDTLFKRTLIMALEQARVLTPELRAKLETLIPQ